MLYIFIAREKELDILNKKINSNKFEFGILYGQKRVGKTRLLLEIFKNYNSIYNLCNEMGLEYNLKQLSDVVAKYINESFTFDSFDLLFDYLVKKSKTQKIIVIIDEFTYLMKTNNENNQYYKENH